MNTLLLMAAVILGCGGEEPVQPIVIPSNLGLTITKGDNGLVAVEAVATNAKYYQVDFGASPSQVPIITGDGRVAYSYPKSGTYTITVQAHATSEVFISVEEEVTVVVPAPTVPIPKSGYSTPVSYDGMTLIWQDEFTGSTLNPDYWTHEIGTGTNGWGNNELEYYRKENTSLQDDCLVITARKESYGGRSYTSSRIISRGKKEFRYGRIDLRAALPQGQGIWPALWMLGSNITSVGWPACGEMDIMEMIGGSGRENTVHGTLHWDNAGSHAYTGKTHQVNSGSYQEEFHVFSLVWDESFIRWYVDDVQYNVIDITPAGLSEFHEDFFVIINLAVGGNWPGNPDGSTEFPQHLIVDYVRVFQTN